MIDDLDASIQTLLSSIANVTVSFERPDSSFPPTGVTLPAVDFFLYDIRENTELRSTDTIIERTNGRATASPPPVRVDCSYLVTAWPSETSPTPAKDEHQLLGQVMMVLLSVPTLPAAVLQGELKADDLPLPTTTLQPSRLQSSGEFWQAMGGKPKAALAFGVTIAVQPGDSIQVPVVEERGRILRIERTLTDDVTAKAAAAAVARVAGTADQATTYQDVSNPAAAYRVRVATTDGAHVTVALDRDYNVLSVGLTGDGAAKAEKAALAKVDGTADWVTTADGSNDSAAAYEVHVTTSNGPVMVILDENYNVLSPANPEPA